MERREFLKVCANSSLALSALGKTGPLEATERNVRTPLLLIFLSGGISAKEFTNPDPPSSPANLRGPLGTVQAQTPGVHFSEVWPQLASRQDKFSILRAVDSGTTDHERGAERIALDGSRTISERIGDRAANGGVPYALLNPNRTWPALDSAFRRNMAFSPQYDERTKTFIPPQKTPVDLTERRRLLESFDSNHIQSPITQRMQRFQETAFDLLQGGGRFFNALNLPEGEKRRYGNSFSGNLVLTAKRLLEYGAGAVTVYHEKGDVAWDMHGNIGQGMRADAPELDHAVATLIDEIDSNRLNAVLLMIGEFNRTPAVNRGGGRDHWPEGNQALVAGGGVRKGVVHGRTNTRGNMTDGIVRQRGQLGNTLLAATGEEINPALPRVREVLQ